MKLKGHKHSLRTAIAFWLVALVAYALMGCAGGAVRPNCADDSIVAAQIYQLRTGHKTYIVKSADGAHAQAYAIINGAETPLRVFPAFSWYILPVAADDLGGGRGEVYTVDEFIRGHGPWRER